MSINKSMLVLIILSLSCHTHTLQVKVKSYSYSQSHIDDWADTLIQDVKSQLWSTDADFIRIPDLQAETRNQVGKIPLQFEIFARKGYFGSLVSMRRKNGISVTTADDGTEIELELEITQAGAYFEDCIVRCGRLRTLQELEVLMSPPVVTVTLTVQHSGRLCHVELQQVRVEEFRGLSVKCDDPCVSGEKELFNGWITNYLNSHVCSAIGSTLTAALSNLLEKHNICLLIT